MAVTVRLLCPGDEGILSELAIEDAAFDVEGRGHPLQPLAPPAARDYLANPAVLHWVAWDGARPLGFLLCLILPLRSGSGRELLLYEIGVRHDRRRQGIGRGLLETMRRWMRDNGVADVWVVADNPGAVRFYAACGFSLQTGFSACMVSTA